MSPQNNLPAAEWSIDDSKSSYGDLATPQQRALPPYPAASPHCLHPSPRLQERLTSPQGIFWLFLHRIQTQETTYTPHVWVLHQNSGLYLFVRLFVLSRLAGEFHARLKRGSENEFYPFNFEVTCTWNTQLGWQSMLLTLLYKGQNP